jgi:hypothetical protein
VDFVPHLFSRKKATKNPRQVVPKSLQRAFRWQQKSPAWTKPSGAVSLGGGTQTPTKRSGAARGCACRRPRVPSYNQGVPDSVARDCLG